MAQAAHPSVPRRSKRSTSAPSRSQLSDALSIAQEKGLLSGGRTHTVRGRMPSLLVEQAKKKTGIDSDSKLLEAALVHLVVADTYADWLLANRGTVSEDLDLEF